MTGSRRAVWRQLPRSVWALGFVSMFMDISSEMIHAILPMYIVSLGASAMTLGLIEGVAEATANIAKVFSGVLSDRMRRRKPIVVFGYALAAFTKPVFAIAASVPWVVAARLTDRIGKGIRGAPRDALVADVAPPHLRGASFGLRQSLDTVGAFIGPLLAIGVMSIAGLGFRAVFWLAVIPAFIAVATLLFGVDDAPVSTVEGRSPPVSFRDAMGLPTAFWLVCGVGALLTLARFSEAFLILRASTLGLPVALVPAILVVMNIAYALAAYPAGVMADRLGRWGILGVGAAVLIAADLVIARAPSVGFAMGGVVLWGVHMGLTQGVFAALVAECAPPTLRGTAFGVFNLIIGLALLAASMIAGAVWEAQGPGATFVVGAGFSALALLAMAPARSVASRAAASVGGPRP